MENLRVLEGSEVFFRGLQHLYPRFKSGCHLQQFPPKSKDFGGFCYIFTAFCRAFEASKKTSLLKIGVFPTKRPAFWQLKNQQSIAAQWIAGFTFLTGNQLAVYTRSIAIAASSEVLRPLT